MGGADRYKTKSPRSNISPVARCLLSPSSVVVDSAVWGSPFQLQAACLAATSGCWIKFFVGLDCCNVYGAPVAKSQLCHPSHRCRYLL